MGVSLRGATVETVPYDAKADDPLELKYEGGLHRWVRVDQLREDLQKRNSLFARGGIEDGEIFIPPDLGAPAKRSAADLLLKGLKILGVDPVGRARTWPSVTWYPSSLEPANVESPTSDSVC